jgi:transcriptional regulator with XRE-family HTH domain
MTEQRVTNAVDRHIGNQVRARRLAIGMTQEKLADLLGITFQQVQKYEKGVNRIAASRLYEITQALDVSVAYFFEGLAEQVVEAKHRRDPR